MGAPANEPCQEELAHAILSASGFKKWSTCTMAAAMEDGMPDDTTVFAREGTFGHRVAELMLRCWLSGNDGADVEELNELVHPECNPDAKQFWTPEFRQHVRTFVDFVIEKAGQLRAQHGEKNVQVLLEQRLSFRRWVPEGFGTADVVIIVPGKIIVIDLKMGAGVFVDGENNGQIRLYGLGAYERYRVLYDFDEIEVWIHQPRKDNVSGEVLPVEGVRGVLEWAEQVVVPRARVAWAARLAVKNGEPLEPTGARFSPGEHCSNAFCKARFVCAARARYMLEAAEMPGALEPPHKLRVDQLEAVVHKASLAARWLRDVETYLVEEAAAGRVRLKTYKVVPGRSVRQITDVQKAAAVLIKNGYAPAKIYKDPELVGLTALEKLVGPKKLSNLLGDLLRKPPGSPILAPLDSPPVSLPPRETATQTFGQYEDN
jgi:hypothetical protein